MLRNGLFNNNGKKGLFNHNVKQGLLKTPGLRHREDSPFHLVCPRREAMVLEERAFFLAWSPWESPIRTQDFNPNTALSCKATNAVCWRLQQDAKVIFKTEIRKLFFLEKYFLPVRVDEGRM